MRRCLVATMFALGLGLAAPAAAREAGSTPTPEAYEPGGRSGFWTSRRPAKGGAYRWRLLGIGVVFAVGGGLLIRHVIRRANAERVADYRAK